MTLGGQIYILGRI